MHSQSHGVELTILLPCLNEARTVAKCVTAGLAFLSAAGVHGEVLVVDNGSLDDSAVLAAAAGARVISASTRGYGAALMTGIHAARGRYVVMGDADDSYDLSSLDAFLERLRDGVDLVMGNRFRGHIERGAMPFLHRYLGNPVLSFLGRAFFRVDVGDFHCGIRGFDRAAVERLGLNTGGMEFASEMVAKAALAQLRIEEVPTVLRRDGRGRTAHLRTWRDGWRHLLFMLLYTPRWLFLWPGVALLACSLLGYGLLETGGLNFRGGIGLGIHSLLYMGAAAVLGFQLIQLAFLTKWVSVVTGIAPSPVWLDQLAAKSKVETGLVAGLLLLVIGIAWSGGLVVSWGSQGYGALDPDMVMRRAIPAVTLMILGVQAIAGSLFAGALNFAFLSWKARQSSHDREPAT